MPTYAYACASTDCRHEFYKVLTIGERHHPQPCPVCQGVTHQAMTTPNFVLQGDGWAGKNIRIQGQMAAKNRRLDAKSRDMPTGQRLVPNVGGEEVESWTEAKRLAASKGMDTTSYERRARQEGEAV